MAAGDEEEHHDDRRGNDCRGHVHVGPLETRRHGEVVQRVIDVLPRSPEMHVSRGAPRRVVLQWLRECS